MQKTTHKAVATDVCCVLLCKNCVAVLRADTHNRRSSLEQILQMDTRIIALIIAAAAFAAINWRKAALFQTDNDALRARVETLENEVNQSTQTAELVKTSAEKLRTQTSELAKLRGEVTQLRTVATNATALSAENQRLRQQLQARGSAVPPAQPSPLEAYAGRDQFPRNSWNFAGYASFITG